MRTSKISVFVGMCGLSAALVLAVACGAPKGDAVAPSGVGSASPSGSPASSAAPTSSGAASGDGTTTTTQLDASDLQGAKLSSSTHVEVETKGDGGPRKGPGGKSDEPGRRIEDIATIVKTRRDEARACYDKALKDHPGIEGDLDIKWTIDPQGVVSDIAVNHQKSQIHEDSVGNCIIDIIKKVHFAPSQKGFETRASYPFNFHPKNAPAGKDAGK